jgi:hypothetical protein
MGITPTQILAAANLAAIAYIDEDDPDNQKTDMADALKALKPNANGPWTLTWGPANNDGVLAFVAKGADGTATLAFRGSLSDDDAEGFFNNWLDDVSAVDLVPWLYPQSAGANISSGMNGALALVIGLTDPTTDLSLLDYLRSVASQHGGTLDLSVTGHSLGGALTPLAAAWLVDQLPKATGVNARIVPFTFAAPTSGDAKFAALFNELFSAGAYGCVNTQDVVPMAWANVQGAIDSFGPNGQTLDEYSFTLWLAAEGVKIAVSHEYVPLTYTIVDAFAGPAIADADDWPAEASIQHSMANVYLPHVKAESRATAAHA